MNLDDDACSTRDLEPSQGNGTQLDFSDEANEDIIPEDLVNAITEYDQAIDRLNLHIAESEAILCTVNSEGARHAESERIIKSILLQVNQSLIRISEAYAQNGSSFADISDVVRLEEEVIKTYNSLAEIGVISENESQAQTRKDKANLHQKKIADFISANQ